MDPIANTITTIKNGYLARKKSVVVPYSRLKEDVAKKIKEAGFVESVKKTEDKRSLEISLLYENGNPAVSDIKRTSKPSLRIYTPAKRIPRVLAGRGEVIVSTSKGILTGEQARKARVGGELLLKVW
ncbi:MAG TPA: 30S ribosomal protein S8 [Candidatus Nanoarchaeia archaeon]